MKGNTLAEFMDDLLTMGGPEKEFTFNGKMYMLETYYDREHQFNEMVIVEFSTPGEPCVFSCKKKRWQNALKHLNTRQFLMERLSMKRNVI